MQKIILSLVIQQYVPFYHPNSRICQNGTKSCVVVSVAYITKVCINIYYHGAIIILKNLNNKATMIKTEDMVK